MQVKKLQYKQPESEPPCFRCHRVAAEYRVTMAMGKHGGKLIVCLCKMCVQLPETELYAHFAEGGAESEI